MLIISYIIFSQLCSRILLSVLVCLIDHDGFLHADSYQRKEGAGFNL